MSCSHTNNLSKYDLNKTKILMEKSISGDINNVNIITSSSPSKGQQSAGQIAADLAISLGSIFVNNEVANKFIKVANPDSIANYILQAIENSLIKYFHITPTYNVSDNYEYICNLTLDNCQLTSTENGIFLNMSATTTIIERSTGAIVWEDSESKNVNLRFTYHSGKTIQGISSNLEQVAMLASLTEAEIAQAVKNAANEIARLFDETLREDIKKINKKK